MEVEMGTIPGRHARAGGHPVFSAWIPGLAPLARNVHVSASTLNYERDGRAPRLACPAVHRLFRGNDRLPHELAWEWACCF